MLHAPEWITAWRLKQAYSLSDSDVTSLIQSLANAGHVSLHSAWTNFKTLFLLPKIQSLPDHWRSIFDNLGYDPDVPSWIERARGERDELLEMLWIERARGERDELLEMLRIVASQTDRNGVERAVDNLYREIYESDTTPLVPIADFCESFFYCDGVNNSAFFERVFADSLLFNKVAAIECLKNAHYPFVAEVKGITKDFVKTVSSTIQQPPSLPDGFKDSSIPATDYMKSFAWLQERWDNIQLEDVAVILWKHRISPSRISASPGSITGFPPESFYTMGSLTDEDSEEKKRLFHIDQRQVEKLEREYPDFVQITDEDRQKYRAAIAPIPELQCLKTNDTNVIAKPDKHEERQLIAKDEVSQKEAAEKLEVTERTIRNWENGKTTPPEGYPGRRSRTNFFVFVNDYRMSKSFKNDARAKNRAVPGGDMSEYSEGADF